MAKFSVTSLLNQKTQEKETDNNEFDASSIKNIDIYDIVPSKENFYSANEIDELADTIEFIGLKQNLVVNSMENGKYQLIAGHRRRLALLKLVEEREKKEFRYVPCKIEKQNNTQEGQIIKELTLIFTNFTREKTAFEKTIEAKRVKELLTDLKKCKGVKIEGRIRDLVAEILRVSSAQVAKMENINNNLIENFKEEFRDEKIGISTAAELAGLPEEKQKETYEEYKEKGEISTKKVKEKKKEEKLNQEETGEIPGQQNLFNFSVSREEQEAKNEEPAESEETKKPGKTEKKAHWLKTEIKYFEAVEAGTKTFEYRINDRDFQPGDKVVLLEYDTESECLTGRQIEKTITYVLQGGIVGVPKTYCVFSIAEA